MLHVEWKLPKNVQLKATYTIEGKADPHALVKVEAIAKAGSIQQPIGQTTVKADEDGNFSCVFETHKIPNWLAEQNKFTDVTFVASVGGTESSMTQRKLEG